MAITFPRAFPLNGCFTENGAFDLDRAQSHNPTGGGSPDVVEIADPLWSGEWRTRSLSRAEFAEWDAWLTSLRGGLRLFKGRPNRHRWPLAYPRGFSGLTVSASPFSGSGVLDTIGAGRDTVTIASLPVGFVLSVGDWFSIPVGSRQRLHRILEGGTADGSGEVDLTIEPIIDPVVVTSGDPVPVLFDAPYCDMNMPEKANVVRYPTGGGEVSFKGRQVLI